MSGIDEQPIDKLEKIPNGHKKQLDLYGKLFQDKYGYVCERRAFTVRGKKIYEVILDDIEEVELDEDEKWIRD